ncbi:MAG: hypothetical protein CVU05_06310 [Bacteroidetes bacterium HGW-Bacteroidetes-21]|jgi:hypothetical protein|nr:MAG: hypothetical protein CVU05_06310 [Bacteroidetes bacterium HGW-Bacteroidetes-21]
MNKHFKSIIEDLLKSKGGIIIPTKFQIESWKSILEDWINDKDLPLFYRSSSSARWSLIDNSFDREIRTTDNTPAFWVFCKLVLKPESIHTKNTIKDLISSKQFPISFVYDKESRKNGLTKEMSSNKEIRINEIDEGYKLAHIEKIALTRKKEKSIDDYITHHRKFLSLENMYAINKKYAGLAEVNEFNCVLNDYLKLGKL